MAIWPSVLTITTGRDGCSLATTWSGTAVCTRRPHVGVELAPRGHEGGTAIALRLGHRPTMRSGVPSVTVK